MLPFRSTLLALTLLSAPALALQDGKQSEAVLGTWSLTVNFDGAAVPMTLNLSQAQGGLAGTLQRGESSWELGQFRTRGSVLAFQVGSAALAFRGRIENDELVGGFLTPFGTIACTGSRGGAEPWAAVLGSWEMNSSFNGQEIPATLSLTLGESGARGVWESMGREMQISDLRFDGTTLTFVRSMGGNGELTFTGKVDGDSISGMQSGAMGEIPCKGVREAAAHDEAEGKSADHDETDATTADHDETDATTADHDETEDSPLDREAWLDKLEADYDARGRRAVPRDAFNVFNNPEMTPAAKAETVQFEEPVVGVYVDGVAKAYPISTLKSSELVNDMCGDVPIAASW